MNELYVCDIGEMTFGEENVRIWRRISSGTTTSNPDPTSPGLITSPDLHIEKPTTNRVSYVTLR